MQECGDYAGCSISQRQTHPVVSRSPHTFPPSPLAFPLFTPPPILEPVPFHIDIWDPSQVRRHRVDDRSHLRPSPLSGSTFHPRTGCREEYSKTTAVVALFSLIYICPLPPCPPPKKTPTCCKKILSQLIFLKSTAAEVCGRWCLNAFESVTMKHDFKVSLSCHRRIAKTPCWTCLQN